MDGCNLHSLLLPFFDHAPTVPWFPLIWLKKGIPKHCSLAWLMQLNRSPTRDRLISWGLQTDPLCLTLSCPLRDPSSTSTSPSSPGRRSSMRSGGSVTNDFIGEDTNHRNVFALRSTGSSRTRYHLCDLT